MDKRIIKEWNKIKDFNLFESIEDFAALFSSKPYGVCLRKYTSYPWCKENFFFGTYEELKEWYKTTDEIPFYVKDGIGQKFGKLTILDFEYAINSKGLRTLHAKCKCDCGNIILVEYRCLKHGDVVGCGCKKEKSIKSVFEYFPDLVKERWDYDKNTKSPQEVSFNSDEKFWWKGFRDSYLMAPCELLGKPNGTSFPEQAIFFYLEKQLSNVENRAKLICGNSKIEVDIFLADYNIAIEYDGYNWHKDKLQKDIDKSNSLANEGIYLIRARESGLIDFDMKNGTILNVDIINLSYIEAIATTINNIIDIIKNMVDLPNLDRIQNLPKTILRDKTIIESRYLLSYEKSNIANLWLIEFWDAEKNIVEPYKISVASIDKFYFKCNAQKSLLISPNTIVSIRNKLKSAEDKIQFENALFCNNSCPFAALQYCPCNALYHIDDLQSPCALFEDYNATEPLSKIIYASEPYEILADKNLRLTPYLEYKEIYLNYIKTINDYNDTTKVMLTRHFNNLLFYRVSYVNNTIAHFLDASICDEVKQKYLERILCYPNIILEDICRVFESKSMRDFYFSHFNYNIMFEDEGNIILNLSHNYPIFDVLHDLVYEKKFNILADVVSTIKSIVGQNKTDAIILSLALQLSLAKNYRYKEVKNSPNLYNKLKSTLLSNVSSTEIILAINKLIEDNNSAINFFQEFIKFKIDNNTLTQKDINELKNKFEGDLLISYIEIVNGLLNLYKDNHLAIYQLKRLIDIENYYVNSIGQIIFPKSAYISPKYLSKLTNGYDSFTLQQKQDILFIIDCYLSETTYNNVNVSNITEPKKYLDWFNKYGTGRFLFDINVISKDDGYSKDFFNLLLKIYDDEPNYMRLHINLTYILTQCQQLFLSKSLSNSFIIRLKKFISYIQCHRFDLSTYKGFVSDDINKLFGIKGLGENKQIYRIYDIDEPIRFKKYYTIRL